jgi:hypothetical protein
MQEARYRIEISYTTTDFRGLATAERFRKLGYDVTEVVTSDNLSCRCPHIHGRSR